MREVRNPLPVLESRQTTLRHATPASGNALFGKRSYGTCKYLRQHWLAEGGGGGTARQAGAEVRERLGVFEVFGIKKNPG